jgi:hypothetical protein
MKLVQGCYKVSRDLYNIISFILTIAAFVIALSNKKHFKDNRLEIQFILNLIFFFMFAV